MVAKPPTPVPLYVDLDGSLIKSDLLVESALRLFKRSPLNLFRMVSWLLLGGKARLKHEIAQRVELDAGTLPYRTEVIELIRHARDAGRPVVLATASNLKFAQQVADHVALFDGVLASSAGTNLSGSRKLEAIRQHSAQAAFSYVGNEATDMAIWRHAESAVVCADAALAKRASAVTRLEAHLDVPSAGIKTFVRAIRLHQWVKNALIFLPFVPLVSSLPWTEWMRGVVGFVCFGLCASSVYLINDLLDLDADRVHARKKFRPIPSGDLSLTTAIALVPVLLLAAFALALVALPLIFSIVLLVYWLLTNFYSLDLKRRVNVDIVALAILYTMRLLAGSAILMIRPSFWILAFSVFFFFSLATAKRMIELDNTRKKNASTIAGRGYIVEDMAVLLAQGTASGQIAVLVFALYINSANPHFHWPEALWGICPLMLLWINRVWLKVNRGELHDDPVVFALRDGFSRVAVLLAAVCIAIAA